MLVDELAQHIFEGRSTSLSTQFRDWLGESRRFQAFAEEHQNKIRKKVRLATDAESLLDLRCELETAYRLLDEKKFTLEYEKYGHGGQRSPDLTATFRAHTLLNIEVTRPRITGEAVEKLMETLCVKVGQMLNNDLNLLVIYTPEANSDDLIEAGKTLRGLAEGKDEAFFNRRRFKNAKDFVQQYQNLSGVGLKTRDVFIWNNPLAKKPLPGDLRNTLQKTL
jgi:hypothetical protein